MGWNATRIGTRKIANQALWHIVELLRLKLMTERNPKLNKNLLEKKIKQPHSLFKQHEDKAEERSNLFVKACPQTSSFQFNFNIHRF